MNKKLIALAVAGATCAPLAMAQSANPVTLYGRVYLSLESVKASGGATPAAERLRVSDNASLLGVRMTEDLGGGLKAFAQLETGFAPDANMTSFATRNSGVGLQGGFGTIMMGRWDMPFKSANIAIDPFGDLTIGGITSGASDNGNFDRRDQNVIQYWSPSMAGFAVKLAMTANETKSSTTNSYDQGASLTYSKGPLYAFYAYEEHKDQVGSTVTAGKKEEGNSVGGSYDFGPIKVGALAQEFKKTGLTKKKTMMANAVYTAGKHQFIYQYTNTKDGAAAGAAQPECDVNAIGHQYNFTKRTFSLIQYTKTKNNAASACRIGSFVSGNDSDPEGFAVGLRHVF